MAGDMIASTLHWAAAKLGREAALTPSGSALPGLPASSRAASGSEPTLGSASRSNATSEVWHSQTGLGSTVLTEQAR